MDQWNEPAEREIFEREMAARGEKCARNAKGDYIDQGMYRAWIVWEIARHTVAPPAAGVPDAKMERVLNELDDELGQELRRLTKLDATGERQVSAWDTRTRLERLRGIVQSGLPKVGARS
jgi:hypothetical protein